MLAQGIHLFEIRLTGSFILVSVSIFFDINVLVFHFPAYHSAPSETDHFRRICSLKYIYFHVCIDFNGKGLKGILISLWLKKGIVKRVAIFKNGNATKKPQFSIRDRNSWKNWTVVNEIVTNFGYLMFGATSLWNHKGILRPLRVWLVFLSALSAMYFKMAYFEGFIDSSTSKYTFSRHFDERILINTSLGVWLQIGY